MTKEETSDRAWYIGVGREDVGDAAILIGDPARITRVADHLEDPVFLPENRGLRAVTGIRTFLRIGTAMAIPPAAVGEFVLADGALRADGTSDTYAPRGYPAIADFALNTALRRRLGEGSRRWHAGIFGTYDGFYTEMFGLSGARREMIGSLKKDIERMGLIGTDMETSALLVAARVLGARASTLCVATVDAHTQEKIGETAMAEAEVELFEVALDALASLPA